MSEPVRPAPPTEVWLRGPVEGVPAPLQPAVHALLQVGEELARLLPGLDAEAIAATPGGAASIGFHVRHLVGSTDRLLTYAEGRPLSDEQRAALASESRAPMAGDTGASLAALARTAIDGAVERIRRTPPESLGDPRSVGRAALPSTVGGLLFHAAEHAARHAGQVITTARIVSGLATGAGRRGGARA